MKKNTLKIILMSLASFAAVSAGAANPPKLDHSLGAARASASGNTLTVSTGVVKQQWTLVPTGLATTSLVNLASGKEWCAPGNTTCDWGFYGLLDGRQARLVSLTADTDNDEGFAREHIRVLAEFEYPGTGLFARYEIWAFPGANGLMTRLWFKGDGEKHFKKPARAAADDNQIVFVSAAGKRPWFTPFSFKPPQPAWFNSVAFEENEPLKVSLENLNPKRNYKIGISFFNNVTDRVIEQSVQLTSGNGNNAKTITLIDSVVIQPYSKTKAAPQTIFVDIPAGTLAGGAAKLVFTNKKKGGASNQAATGDFPAGDAGGQTETAGIRLAPTGDLAMASEVIVYEKSDKPSIREIPFNLPARQPQLVAAAPAGHRLVGYGALGTKINHPTPPNGWLARLPVANAGATTRTYGGYYSDTQNRNLRETPLLHEDVYTNPISGTERERVGWASFVALQDARANEGLVMLKESHKCINSFGVDAGDFILDATGLANTGLSMRAKDVVPGKYTKTWANWTILHTGADAPLAIKKFDRARFPLMTEHIKMTSNTWGLSKGTGDGRYRAREENVLKEIAAAADIGVDGVQIDAGWHGQNTPRGQEQWRPAKKSSAAPHGAYALYPDGWKNICNAANKAGVQLGFWSAHYIPLESLIWNYDHGCFRFVKVDYLYLGTRAGIDNITQKARDFILHTKHNMVLDWDLTELGPRMGVYFGREYGNLFLANRKTVTPAQTIYTPYLVLRDAWHASKYINLNRIQMDIQNVAAVPAGPTSNASEHEQDYAVAIALMSSPLFFCELQYFDEPARAKMRPLIAAWKRERDNLARGYVHPIGAEPDDASWTGFQNHIEDSAPATPPSPSGRGAAGEGLPKANGYLLIFRELNNTQSSATIALNYVAGKTLRLTDLITGKTFEAAADKQGRVNFTMEKPGDYRFYRYETR